MPLPLLPVPQHAGLGAGTHMCMWASRHAWAGRWHLSWVALGNGTVAVGRVGAGHSGMGQRGSRYWQEPWVEARSMGNCLLWHLLSAACCLLELVMLSDYMGNPN